MKVLISAIACHPQWGSEAFVGWQAVSAMRDDHELWVITDQGSRSAIDVLQAKDPEWKNVHFCYVGDLRPCHPNRLVARLESWIRYQKWCSQAKSTATKLCGEVNFDAAHHVTYATWRMGSPVCGLGVPWIWGPIGGGETFPWRLFPILKPVSLIFEVVRAISSFFSARSSKVSDAVKNASIVVASNRETGSFLSRLEVKKQKIQVLSQAHMGSERLRSLAVATKESPQERGLLEIIAGGNLEGRKGVFIALHGLARLKMRGIPFRYLYLGRGPEFSHLKKLTCKLGLEDQVSFIDSLKGDDYSVALKRAHVFLLPSLRESAGITLIEAMAAGCVPLVADCGGPADISREAGVRAIPVATMPLMVKFIEDALSEHWLEPLLWEKKSKASILAVQRKYSTEHYKREMQRFYDLAVCSKKLT